MISFIRNAFKVPDLRKRLLFTLTILALYRLGANLPAPGVNVEAISQLAAATRGGLLGLLDLFACGALFERFAIFALGIMPYITASIIMELLRVVIPKIGEWAKEGEVGRRKITQWTRYLTLVLAITESIGLTFLMERLLRDTGLPIRFDLQTRFLIIITLVTGAALIMWLGELITERGISNGMSLIIFANIVSRIPHGLILTYQAQTSATARFGMMLTLVALILVVVVAIIFVESGQRRIPVQYAKRIVGRKMYGGQSTYIPMKINSAGVIPIIFASSVLLFPGMLANFFPGKFFSMIAGHLETTSALYLILFSGLIIFFAYFYTAIIFNPIELSDNIKKYGGFIPGVRPGYNTAVYFNKILNRITLPGAIFLALIAVLPTLLISNLNIPFFRDFGGTALLIVVGVALETVRQIESQLLMRHYEGFLH
ncbi:MAG: preprotein translocase subunit SecY [Candidatus Subteraquimicrobiales bacterium]|nr:preprotein translocase subunit SecY [Candidatus Subteraquimicrobiales bacterium]